MSQSKLKVRLAEPRDVDAITALIIESMEYNPLFTYSYSYRAQYPEDLYAGLRASTRASITDTNIIMTVATLVPPFLDDADDFPIAAAVWMPPADARPAGQSSTIVRLFADERRDINRAHEKAAAKLFPAADKSYFEEQYGTRRMHLRSLATHPRYQRRGAAAALVRWGMEKAREEGMPVTLFSAGPAQPFYERLGFERVGEYFELKIEGEEEKINVAALMYSLKSS